MRASRHRRWQRGHNEHVTAAAIVLALLFLPTSTPPAPFDQSATTVDAVLALRRPVVLAHTGGEDRYPGSTMFAFRNSMAAGVDVLDLNVTLSADDVLVVQHDLTVDRTTDGTGTVAEMTYDELHALDNAYWFTADCGACTDQPDEAYLHRGIRTGAVPPPAGSTADDFAIPTLAEVVAAFPEIPLNVEIKGSGELAMRTADALVAELTERDRLDGAVVASFEDDVVAHVSAIAPDVEVSPGLAATAAFIVDGTPLPAGQRILQLPPRFESTELLTPDIVDAIHDGGYVVWVWPNDRALENSAAYTDFLSRGVDGLNVNDPAAGVAAVEGFTAAQPPASSGA
jgi:glycerophosphoryl diester phosphodiesterase